MQIIRKNNKTEKKIKIRSDTGKSLVLLLSEMNDLLWLQGKIPDLLNRKDGTPVKSSDFSTVLMVQNPETGEIFYFKEFHDRGMKDKLKKLIGSTRSERAFKAGQTLLEKGFLTPFPVAHGLEKACCLVRRNFLITREVPGERTYQYFQSRFPLPLSAQMYAEKRALIHAAGHEIGRLHRMGICHGDLRVGNIIINGRGSSTQFFFIDNERTQFYRTIPERKRMKNLVQLNMVLLPHITRTDRLRFFNTYVMENPVLLSNKKSLIREILRITRKRQESKLFR